MHKIVIKCHNARSVTTLVTSILQSQGYQVGYLAGVPASEIAFDLDSKISYGWTAREYFTVHAGETNVPKQILDAYTQLGEIMEIKKPTVSQFDIVGINSQEVLTLVTEMLVTFGFKPYYPSRNLPFNLNSSYSIITVFINDAAEGDCFLYLGSSASSDKYNVSADLLKIVDRLKAKK